MPKSILSTIGWVLLGAISVTAQEAGNRVYGNQGQGSNQDVTRRYPRYPDATTDSVSTDQANVKVTTYQYIDAKILTSVETQEYIAVFGIAQEADNLPDANRKLQEQVARFKQSLAGIGVRPENIYLDFITQNRVYDFVVKGSTAREKVSGFQIKENLAVRFQQHSLLDQIVPLAAQAGIFDLIKVDYVTGDLGATRAKMFDEAARILKQKEEAYAKIGVKLVPVTVSAETFDTFQPSEAYNSYRAFETGTVDDNVRVVERRKNSTFYFEPLTQSKFDSVLTPLGLEPRVQCTFYLRVKYFVASYSTFSFAVPEKAADKKP